MAARLEALVLEARGDHAGTVKAARRAIELTESVTALLDAERARIMLGRALSATGEKSEAAAELAAAEEELADLGAETHRAEAARVLRKMGRRARPSGGAAAAATPASWQSSAAGSSRWPSWWPRG